METIKDIIEINSENIFELEKINSDLNELKSLIFSKIRKIECKKFQEKDICGKKSYISEKFRNRLNKLYEKWEYSNVFKETLLVDLEYLFCNFPDIKIKICNSWEDYIVFLFNDSIYLEILHGEYFKWKNNRYGKKTKILSILSIIEELKNNE